MLHKLTSYNTWANEIICSFILKAPETADIEVVSSFSSIKKTLLHIWDAQVIWHSRINGVSLSGFPGKDFKGTIDDACKGLIESSRQLTALIAKHKNNSVINYKNLEGKAFQSSLEEIITHVVNHGTYHRGQLITLLRQCGYTDVGSTDYITFCRL
jgi:uncharacterized damage-inducible protein DinB